MHTIKENNLTFPSFKKISESFGLQAYEETPEGSAMISTVDQRERIARLINYGTIAIAIGLFVLSLVAANKSKVFAGLFLGAIAYGIGSLARYLFNSFMINPVKNKYVNKRSKYAFEMAQAMVNYFGGYFYAFGDGYYFLFNPDICLYVNADNGDWLGYDKASIKDVNLSHVQTGSTSISKTNTSGIGIAWTNNVGTYHGSSTTVSESTSHYEWRFDILSDFFEYPNLTLVFPDDSEGQDFAKKAKALLS